MEQSAEEFFSDPARKNTKCKWLSDNNEKALAWEKERVSEYSPGVVLDEEIVARQIFSPLHYDEHSGQLLAAAFKDVGDKGLSVDRMNYSTEQALHENGKAMAEKANETRTYREYFALFKAKVSTIRSILNGDVRLLAAYDTSEPGRISHADICQIATHSMTMTISNKRALKLLIRSRLANAFSEIASP